MDIGFKSVYNTLSSILNQRTLCYYENDLIKTDINNNFQLSFIETYVSVDYGEVTKFKISREDNMSILNDFKINLSNKYTLDINELYLDIKIINHYINITDEIIECIKVPSVITTQIDEINSAYINIISATKFSYGKFEMSWKPRAGCLFEGLTINIEISVKNDSNRDILEENRHILLSYLTNKTNIIINDDGKIGYFKIIGRPSCQKGVDNGKNNQSEIISFNGYYQINYNV